MPVSAPRLSWFAPVLLVVAIIAAYANSLNSPFLFDDAGAVLNNSTIRRLASLDVLRPPADGSTTTGRPLVNLSFALNYALSGERVWSYHATNVALHAVAALLLFGLIRRALSSLNLQSSTCNCDAVALATASLWALHPLQTESVVCIAQRTEVMCGVFFLLTLYAFARGWRVVAVVACLAGMATKEVMVTAPLLVLLYDRTFVAGSFAGAWRMRRSFYVALAGTWLLLAWLVMSNAGARGASAGFGLGVSWWTYLLTQCEALVLYLRLSLWPHPLVLDYGTVVARSFAEVWWQGTLVLSLLVATGWALWRKPVLGFAGAWFFLILAPSSSVVPLVTQTMAEHRMYLPLAALVALVVVALHARLGSRATVLLAGVAVVFATLTLARNRDYHDTVSIWTDAAAKLPQNPRAHHNLALALHHAGRPAEAHARFAHAVALDPDYVTAHYNWGVALLNDARAPEAAAQFAATVRLAPDHYEAHWQLVRLAEQSGRPAAAENHLNEILRLMPEDLAAHRKLGLLLARSERLAPAAEHFRAVLRHVPGDADAHANLGNVLLLAGQSREAIACYEESLRLRPGDVRTRENLQLARASQP